MVEIRTGTRVVVPEHDLDWEGEWHPAVTYVVGDVVYRDGSSYRAKRTTVGDDPIVAGADWEFVARKGDKGDKGDQGEAGLPGVGQSVIILIEEPSNVWIGVHGLGGFPSITTLDSTGRRVFGLEEYLDENTVRITFSASFGGRIILN